MIYLLNSVENLRELEFLFLSNVYASIGECYLKKGKLTETKHAIDSSEYYMNKTIKALETMPLHQYRKLYSLKSKYYAAVGDIDKVSLYVDSALMAERAYEEKFSISVALRAKQEMMEVEQEVKNINFLRQRNLLLFSFIMIILLVIFCIVFVYLYRKKRDAHKVLTLKMQQWAGIETNNVKIDKEKITQEDKTVFIPAKDEENAYVKNKEDTDVSFLMDDIEAFMKANKPYTDHSLTIDMLAEMMNMKKYYLSKAINASIGKNYNTWINEYRIKEAIVLLSDEKLNKISVNDIGNMVGFGNRSNFYRVFKKIAGLSPSDFRQVAQ